MIFMFKPKHVYIEKEALDYTLGKELKKQKLALNIAKRQA